MQNDVETVPGVDPARTAGDRRHRRCARSRLDVPLTGTALQPGFRTASIVLPHTAVRALLFGHELNRYTSAQAAYMRPVSYIDYREVTGAPANDSHHVRTTFGSVTLKVRAPLRRRVFAYGESGYGLTSRTGFSIGGVPAVTDAHYSSLVAGGGVDIDLNPRWSLTGGVLYVPGRAGIDQPRALFSSGGFRYVMRPLSEARLDAVRRAGLVFAKQVPQMEVSTGTGYGVNNFVSRTVPVFWGGHAEVHRGGAVHYERNVFHARRLFSLDVGASAGLYRTSRQSERFHAWSIYPLLRLTFVRTAATDVYLAYSLAGPTYISRTRLDGLDTGHHFTFQDFMGVGVFTGPGKRLNAGVKINHYPNGNIFAQNAGVKIPLTFSLGYVF